MSYNGNKAIVDIDYQTNKKDLTSPYPILGSIEIKRNNVMRNNLVNLSFWKEIVEIFGGAKNFWTGTDGLHIDNLVWLSHFFFENNRSSFLSLVKAQQRNGQFLVFCVILNGRRY